MQVVALRDQSLTLEERETPLPGPYDVVVAVRAAGINAADLLQRRGLYPAPAGWPVDVPGMEFAGLVVAAGERVHEPLLGRRVCGVVGGGAQATHCVVPGEHLLFIPDHVSWLEAGGFAEAFLTAHDALVTQGELARGEHVVISGAAGGVGVAAVQIAHALGAWVTAVTRDATHHDALRALGANHTLTIDELDQLGAVDVVLELVGAAHLERVITHLAPFARVVIIGLGGGARMELDLRAIMATRARVMGSTLRARSREEKALVTDRVAHALVPRWRTGDLHVPISRVFALTETGAAYDYFAQGGKFGKVILEVDESPLT